MPIKKKFSLAIPNKEKIDDINEIVVKYSSSFKQFSSYYYFKVNPSNREDFIQDITFFQLESDDKTGIDKKLKTIIEEINQLNTPFAIRDEDTKEMVVEIDYMTSLIIKFDNVKFIKEGTYKKIDDIQHLKTEYGVCKSYNPNFRPLENTSIENKDILSESIYLFSDSEENLSKLKTLISEKVKEIDSDFEIEFEPFEFRDSEDEYF